MHNVVILAEIVLKYFKIFLPLTCFSMLNIKMYKFKNLKTEKWLKLLLKKIMHKIKRSKKG